VLTAQRGRADEAEARAAILAAQLGGWEAQCAAQLAVLHDLLSYLSGARYNVDTFKRRIEDVTETDAGATLLAAHQQQREQLNEAVAQDVHQAIEQTLAPLDAALASDAGVALLAELAELRASRDAMQEFTRTLILQVGAVDVPLPVAIANLQVELATALRALQVFFQMFIDIKAALDAGAESIDLDPYLFQVGDILKGGFEAIGRPVGLSTTPEEAGRQIEQAMRIAQRFGEFFGEQGDRRE
jgi:hypothetical protein